MHDPAVRRGSEEPSKDHDGSHHHNPCIVFVPSWKAFDHFHDLACSGSALADQALALAGQGAYTDATAPRRPGLGPNWRGLFLEAQT